jgi:hypothetical protein
VRFVFFVMVGLVGVRYHLVLREMERLVVKQGEGQRGEARGSKEKQSQPSRGFLQCRRFGNNGLLWFPDVITCMSLCQIFFFFFFFSSELACYVLILYYFNKFVSLVSIFHQLLND